MALETAVSVITLSEFALKINKLRLDIKDAPEEWQRYKDGLDGIACVP
ncbi:predicted protein [Chaetomium globosum CBS 148.51]|uniref:Uncharacterized protein n=1 Tax=Chaetomium globosum (strain ATCC 6205 / CBS 148.51 / DSM 1962 / NBRC 6347 / NRRL 1970) TaxID=306901 RepID=Q2HB48_CHAGB|nr:uncharacterized protein CHGG_02556 [Chaetomium globosum CBS 148.51]EAQ90621.1 predicted protein [Chaetomium globosum CBS 148.51]